MRMQSKTFSLNRSHNNSYFWVPNMAKDKKLFLLDAYALIFRGYYAFIKNPRLNSKGMDTSAIMGFTNSLFDLINRENPTIWLLLLTKEDRSIGPKCTPNTKRIVPKHPKLFELLFPTYKTCSKPCISP